MKILGIYGAGGLGREVLDLVEKINSELETWEEIVFIDDNKKKNFINGVKVYTFEEILAMYENHCVEFVIALGEPRVRELIYKKLIDIDAVLVNIISPLAEISKHSKMGKGNVVFSWCTIGPDVIMGNNNVIYAGGFLGHDCHMGDHCVFCPNVKIGGNTNIESNVFFGIGSSIKNGVIIENYAVIGMGTVVISDIEKEWKVVGNPGRKIGINTEKKVF